MVNAMNGDFANRRHNSDRGCRFRAGLESSQCSSPLAGFSLLLIKTELLSCKLSRAQSRAELILCQAGSGQAMCTCSSAFTDLSLWLTGEVEQLLQGNVVLASAISTQAHAEAHLHNTTAYAHTPIPTAV